MKIVRRTEQELVVEDSGLWLSAVLALASLPLFYLALAQGKRATLFGAGFFLLCAVICLRKSTFVFDAGARMVHWRTLRFLDVSNGSVAFDAINDIGMESSLGSDSGAPTYRLTILTLQGSIPLTPFYSPGFRRYESQRQELRSFLQLGAQGQTALNSVGNLDSSIRALLNKGRKIDAIRLLRSSSDMDLTEATARVAEMEKSGGR